MTPQPPPSTPQGNRTARLFAWFTSRRLLLAFLWIVTGVALFYGEENWRGRHAWTSYRRDLEARGAKLDFAAFIPSPIADDQNFAATPFVRGWFNHKRGIDARWGDNFSHLQDQIGKTVKNDHAQRHLTNLRAWQLAFAGEWEDIKTLSAAAQTTEERAKSAHEVLEEMKTIEPIFEELRVASQKPFSRYDVKYDLENPWGILLPHLANVRATCSRLEVHASAHLALGQTNQAMQDLELMLYLTDSIKTETFLISYLVRGACLQLASQVIWEGLEQHRWSDAQLASLIPRLQKMNFIADLASPLTCERAAGILTVDLVKRGGLGLLLSLADEGTSPTARAHRVADLCGKLIPSGWYYLEQLNYCRLHEVGLAGVLDGTPKFVSPSRLKAAGKELERQLSGRTAGVFVSRLLQHREIAGLLLPALGNTALKSAVAQTAVQSSLLGCALERYRLAHGQYPADLAALAPQFLSEIPADAIDGQPYRYRPNGKAGYTLYSVGWNETDDGGTPGKVLFDDRGGDWVWQVGGAPFPFSYE